MTQEKEKSNKQSKEKDEQKSPGVIKGKIEIPDTRERRDGPGGN